MGEAVMLNRYTINTVDGIYLVEVGHHGTWDVTHPCGRVSNCEDLDHAFDCIRANVEDAE
jgi:hypothetical protein